ncbi:MAG TPA: transposase family protein [Blastocatellia bacterium]|nr:transposase family protein [Blastocatellia bacterium]
MTGVIQAVRAAKGPKHDYKIFVESGFELPATTCFKVDKGFQGIQLQYPKAQVPEKATKLHPLTKEQKQANRQLARERILVEHVNRECKIFRICQARYRGKHKNYEKTWKLVAALVNLKRATRHLQFASP